MHRTSLSELKEALLAVELPQDQVVMVHSSLLKFGLLEGGAKGACDILAEVLGGGATLVMPAFTWSYGGSRVWHAKDTPSDVGALSEYFRKNVATHRSIHPFHSVSAAGPLAGEVTSGISPSSFGPNSAFQKLYDLGAINLSVGTEFIGGATYLHMGEEQLNVPYRFMKAFPGDVRDMDGKPVDVTFEMFVREITEDHEYDNVWDGCWDDLNARGLFRKTTLKGAMIAASDIRETLDTFKEFLKSDPYYCAKLYPAQNVP